MKPLSVIVLILFFAALAADCYFISENHLQYRFYTKTLLMPLLLIYLLLEAGKTTHKTSKVLIILALCSSFIGDVLLLFDNNDTCFMMGIAAFLITHVFYTIFFTRIQNFAKEKGMMIFFIGLAILIYVIFISIVIWYGVSKDDMEVPVLLYVAAISIMLLSAVNTSIGRLKSIAFIYFIPGAILFTASDSILAMNKFASPISNAPMLIMLTYGLAQFLLIRGSLKVLKKQKSRSKYKPGLV